MDSHNEYNCLTSRSLHLIPGAHLWEILERSLTTVIQTEYFLVDGIGTLGESVTSSIGAGLEVFGAETTFQAHFICHSSVCKWRVSHHLPSDKTFMSSLPKYTLKLWENWPKLNKKQKILLYEGKSAGWRLKKDIIRSFITTMTITNETN